MEIQIKAYAYTIDIITEIRYFCKCNNAVFGKFRIIFTYAISKTDSFLHRSSHALFKISGNGKFVRTAVLPPHLPAISAKAHRTLALRHPSQNRTIPCLAPSPLPFNKRSAGFASALSLAQHNVLASLVKGRWLGGKAQTVALLLPACDMPTLFILQTFLPSRRRDCYTTNPCLAPSPLPYERSASFASALSHPLFVGRGSVYNCTVSHLNYPTRFS